MINIMLYVNTIMFNVNNKKSNVNVIMLCFPKVFLDYIFSLRRIDIETHTR